MTADCTGNCSTSLKGSTKWKITRKYHKDYSGEPNSKYMNIGKVKLTMGIDLDEKLQQAVRNWFVKNPANNVDAMKSTWQKKRVLPLVKHLSKTYSNYFEKEKRSNITNACIAIIQQTLSNDR